MSNVVEFPQRPDLQAMWDESNALLSKWMQAGVASADLIAMLEVHKHMIVLAMIEDAQDA